MDERKIEEQSMWAGLCVNMVSVHVTLKSGERIHAYLMPWNCLDSCRQFVDAGAKAISVHVPSVSWMWFGALTESPAKRKSYKYGRERRGWL